MRPEARRRGARLLLATWCGGLCPRRFSLALSLDMSRGLKWALAEGLVQGTKRRAFLHIQVAAQASRIGSQGFLVPSSALDCSWARSEQPCAPAPLL